MMWKSLQEEWPYHLDELWLRWTTDGVQYHEKIVSNQSLDNFEHLGIAEWREVEPPDWMDTSQKENFIATPGTWARKVFAEDEEM